MIYLWYMCIVGFDDR